MQRRHFFIALPLAMVMATGARADEPVWPALGDGGIVLFRHAHAPGVGDPPGFVIGDCSTQRNLDERGREQARAIGAEFRRRGLRVGQVLSSQWCRARETAELAFPGQVREAPAFNSFFADRSRQDEQTEAALRQLKGWKGPGLLLVFTHQVNVTALTGVTPASGEGLVVAVDGKGLIVQGRIPPV